MSSAKKISGSDRPKKLMNDAVLSCH